MEFDLTVTTKKSLMLLLVSLFLLSALPVKVNAQMDITPLLPTVRRDSEGQVGERDVTSQTELENHSESLEEVLVDI